MNFFVKPGRGVSFSVSIVPVPAHLYRDVYKELERQEPWHMIALEALVKYGLMHPSHRWFVDVRNGSWRGFVYHHEQIVHFAYRKAPPADSALYEFVSMRIPHFHTHGRRDLVRPIVAGLHNRALKLKEASDFVKQTNETKKLIQTTQLQAPAGLHIRTAHPAQLEDLILFFRHTEVADFIETTFLSFLLSESRVLTADYRGRLVGVIMCLKETRRYALIGNLYVQKGLRERGIATLLGRQMVWRCMQRGRQVCFYFSKPELREFYRQAAFRSIGKWVHYEVTSKAVT
jgi:GNAT superfamily N-acetyltransferase